MRIAIATTDSKTVNEHFGKVEEFHIYDLSAEGLKFIQQRKVIPLSIGDKSHAFDEARFKAVLAKIADCGRVYVSKIGEKPAEELRRHGITPILSDASIANLRL